MKDADLERVHLYFGKGRGAIRLVHTPSGIYVEGPTPSSRAVEERLRKELEDKIPPSNLTLNPSWLTLTVRQLTQAIYDEGAFERLPILADALEDAGCDNADILNHCRQPGEHVRGCWVVDLVLGKE
jgi:hypothetical protein